MFATAKYTPPITLSIVARHFYGSDSGYRYRFKGQEQDNEVNGSVNAYDFGARI